MHQMWKVFLNALVLFSSSVWVVELLAAESLDEKVMEYLAKLNFAALQDVEISLDDTFDVFDGLVKKRHTEIASGVKQSTQRTPAVTSVITAQDIEAMGARTIVEVLQTVPGLQVTYNFINIPIYTIRGISTVVHNSEVLILIDGIRLNDVMTGTKGWSNPSINSIARIEIIRGPGSALYGADAFAGVINIITKTKQNIEGTEIGVRLGNDNTQDVWILHGSEWKDFEISTIVDLSNTDGHQRTVEKDAQTVFDQAFGTQASLAPGPYGSEFTTYHLQMDIAKQHWHFRTAIHKEYDRGLGVGIMQSLNPGEPHGAEGAHVNLLYTNPTFSDNWSMEAQLNYQRLGYEADYLGFPPGAMGGTYPLGMLNQVAFFENHSQMAVSSVYRGLDNHLIQLGIGYANYDLYKTMDVKNYGINPFTGEMISPVELVNVSDTFAETMSEIARNNWYGIMQDTWTISSTWELTAGIRYDKYSDFGNTANPRFGSVWEPYNAFVIKLLYGRAFRAPSLIELHSQNNLFTIGNPNLKPEKIATWELAFDYRATNKLNLTLNLFQYKIRDKITTVPEKEQNFGYANATSWKGNGGEFEMRWKTSHKSSLLFNYSYQDSKDKITNVTLHNAPQQAAYLRGDYLFGLKWYINTQVNWNNGWKRVIDDPRPDLAGYTTVDLILRRKDIRAGNTNFAVGVRNLFDTDVRYPSPGPDTNGILNIPNDLPGAGRFYFVEFRYKFQ